MAKSATQTKKLAIKAINERIQWRKQCANDFKKLVRSALKRNDIQTTREYIDKCERNDLLVCELKKMRREIEEALKK